MFGGWPLITTFCGQIRVIGWGWTWVQVRFIRHILFKGNGYTFMGGNSHQNHFVHIPIPAKISSFSLCGTLSNNPNSILPSSRHSVDGYNNQEAHRPGLAHLSEIATADMHLLCNIFSILSLQLMNGSLFKQFLVLKKNVFFTHSSSSNYYFFGLGAS